MLGKYKKALERRFLGVARAAAATRLSPNVITFSGLVFGVAGLYMLAAYSSLTLFLLGCAAMGLMDMLDGLVARYTGSASRFGAFLDSTVDRAEDALISAGFMYAGLLSPGEVLLLLTGMFLISYTRARAESLGVSMSGVGFAERPERILLALLSLILAFVSLGAARAVAWLLIVVVYLTVAQRIHYAAKMLR